MLSMQNQSKGTSSLFWRLKMTPSLVCHQARRENQDSLNLASPKQELGARSHPFPRLAEALFSEGSKEEVTAHLRKWKVTACCRIVSLLEPSSKYLLLWCLQQRCRKPPPCSRKAAPVWALRSSQCPQVLRVTCRRCSSPALGQE